jgi:hypothetical protein
MDFMKTEREIEARLQKEEEQEKERETHLMGEESEESDREERQVENQTDSKHPAEKGEYNRFVLFCHNILDVQVICTHRRDAIWP